MLLLNIMDIKKKTAKIKIKLRAYDHKIIDNSAKQIINIIIKHGGSISGPILLPTKISKFTVNRSPFVHKKSKEQFEIRTHKRLIEIYNFNPKIIEALKELFLPAGLDIEIKMWESQIAIECSISNF